uniref:Interferon stimulated exonuclease gene 20 like 2 n=1 Tax=Neogobius melanostomus TaxID=47308 RepID=A0A8C6S9X5_9GOBI
MSYNDPSSYQRKRWKKNRPATTQNNDATGTQQHNSKPCYNEPDFNIDFQLPQLLLTGETSQVMHRTVTQLDNETTGWRKKKKLKATIHNSRYTTSTRQDNKSHFNDADFTLSRTIKFHPHNSTDSSFKGSSSQSTAAITHSQGSASSATRPICDAATPTRSPLTFTARLGTPAGKTKESADSSNAVAAPSKYLSIDCEMVGTGPKGHISQVARCSIVSYNGDVVYDKFIKPPVPITDYRTRWSGIRVRDLHGATPYAEARKEILMLVKGKVLIGHAIHNDLKVLNYCHAKDLTRDTSRIPLLNVKAGFNEREVVSLKRLTKALFNRDIQTGKKGHSSVEDAKATMDLYKLVEAEWDPGLNEPVLWFSTQ